MEDKMIIEGNRLPLDSYSINENGQLWSNKTNKFMVPSFRKRGYLQYNITFNGKTHTYLAHRLVALRYIPNPDGLPEVNHKDGNKSNNHISNLEWVTKLQNIGHAFENDLVPAPWEGKAGKAHPRSKGVVQLNGNVVIAEYGSAREAAKLSGICYGTISNVLIGRGNTAGGFYWQYNSQHKQINP